MAAAAALIIGIGWWVVTLLHPSLEVGAAFGATGAEEVADPSAGPGEDRTMFLFPYRDGQTAEYLFSLRNPGPLPVTVTDVVLRRTEPGDVFLLQQVEARIGGPGDVFPEVTTPFRPFRLGAEEERTIVITLRFDHCEEHGTLPTAEEADTAAVQFIENETIRYRILGVPRSEKLRLPSNVGVRFPTPEGCPGAS